MHFLRRNQISLVLGTAVFFNGCHGTARRATPPKPVVPRPQLSQPAPEPTLAPSPPSAQIPQDQSSPITKSNTDNSIQLTQFELTQFVNNPEGVLVGETIPSAPSTFLPVGDDNAIRAIQQPGISLEQLEEIALQNNPAIRQATASVYKAHGFREQVGLYPNPTVGYQLDEMTPHRSGQHTAVISQEFVRGQKLELNRQVLDREIQSQMWEVEAQRYRVLTDVRTRYYQALAAQRRNILANEFQAVASEGVRLAHLRLDALEGSLPELLQAEIQLNEVELIQQRAQIAYTAAWQELAAVTGLSTLSQQHLIGDLRVNAPALDQEETLAQLISQSPAVQAARARVQRAIANMTRQEIQAIPNITASISAGYDRGGNNGLFGAGFEIPLPLYNKNQGNLSAAQSEYNRATHEVRRLEYALKQQLAATARDYQSAEVTVRRMEEVILPKAQMTLDLSEKAYSAGEFDYLQVLVARRTFFDSNLSYNDALQELAVAQTLIDGMMLQGGLDDTRDLDYDDSLRDQSLGGN